MNFLTYLAAGAAGALGGALANAWAERWAFQPRGISPWLRLPLGAARRPWTHFVPILGWSVRRAELHAIAPHAWLRPLLIELIAGALFILLVWLHASPGHWIPLQIVGREVHQVGIPVGTLFHNPDAMWRLAQIVAMGSLIVLMFAASLADIDEQIIPDEITVPGTYLGLALAALWPATRPPGAFLPVDGRMQAATLTLMFPNDWPAWLDGAPHVASLLLALGCYAAWYFGMWPWLFRPGRRAGRAMALTWAFVRRHGRPFWMWCMPLCAAAAIVIVWRHGGERWAALLSALVGATATGALIWLFRLVSANVLRVEALGFGDVTLMAMISAFLGWQPCVLVLFAGAILALAGALVRLILVRDNKIFLGPFLCLGALLVVLKWPNLWYDVFPAFEMGGLVPLALLVCLAPLWGLLHVVRFVKRLLFGNQAGTA